MRITAAIRLAVKTLLSKNQGENILVIWVMQLKEATMKQYYEGWYMKQQQDSDVLAVIPGRAQNEAFVQVITPKDSYYVPYSLESYSLNGAMKVGNNVFTPEGMDVAISTDELELYARVRYEDLSPLRYDIMGPFALLPMETKHTVFSMRHRVRGDMLINGKDICFGNGIGYMEGDRGHSFPQGYTWIQSTDFGDDTSVMLAIASIPFGLVKFTGCIAVVYFEGREYRFATYLGVHIVNNDDRYVEVRQGDMCLHVQLLGEQGHLLQAPVLGEMDRQIKENPAVPARIVFEKKKQRLIDAICPNTSFEYVQA